MPPAPGLAGATLRQIVQPALGGERVRVGFSNRFGEGPLPRVRWLVVLAGINDIGTATGARAASPRRAPGI